MIAVAKLMFLVHLLARMNHLHFFLQAHNAENASAYEF